MNKFIYIAPELSNPNHYANQNWTNVLEDLYPSLKKIDSLKDEIEINGNFYFWSPRDREIEISLLKEIANKKLFIFFSDDEWRWKNYDRYLALYADFFSITDESHLEYYKKWGFDNVIATTWAANPKNFYPMEVEKIYDVTFIGAAYGKEWNI